MLTRYAFQYTEDGSAQNANASKGKKNKARRKRAERAKTRKLVRWNGMSSLYLCPLCVQSLVSRRLLML